jgi:hypothetical protein
MRKLLVMAVVIGAGAMGFSAVSQAGISLRTAQAEKPGPGDKNIVTKYDVPGCRIEKTMKLDFHGNPYLKKVRICA